MKYLKFIIHILTLVLCTITALNFKEVKAEVKYAKSEIPMGEGVKNIYLSYISESHLSVDDYVTILNYVKKDGTITKNTYMDTVILLPAFPYGYGENAEVYIGRDSNDFTNIEIGKSKFKNKYMVEQEEILDLIDAAAAKIEKLTGEKKTVNILLSSFLPNINKNNELTKFFVDTQKQAFEEAKYEHLKLIGFYYYQEEIYTEQRSINATVFEGGDDLDAEVYFNDYVHSLPGNYKTMWIPYYEWSEKNYLKGYDFGFDYVNFQSSYYFKEDSDFENYNTSYGIGRRGKANEIAFENHFGIEVEFDSNLFASAEYYKRYIEFLKTGVAKGWNQPINVYYEANALVTACASKNEQDREICDLTYKYANDTLQLSDLEGKEFSIEYPGKYNLVSKGKDTTLDKALFAGSTCIGNNAYCDVDGTELTDGVYALDSSGWVLFRNKNTTEDHYEVIVDLSKIETSLSYFGLEMIVKESWGMGIPHNVEFFYSNNGSNYQKLGNALYYDAPHGERAYVYLELKNAVDARYIKAVFDKGDHTFVALSEFTIGKTATVDLESSSGTVYLSNPNINVKVTAKDSGTLSVTSRNNNIATCSLLNGSLVIKGVSEGSTTCEVKESNYGVSEVYSIMVKDDKNESNESSKEDNKEYSEENNVDNPSTGVNSIHVICFVSIFLGALAFIIIKGKKIFNIDF